MNELYNMLEGSKVRGEKKSRIKGISTVGALEAGCSIGKDSQVSINEKVTSEPRLEGGEGMSQVDFWVKK